MLRERKEIGFTLVQLRYEKPYRTVLYKTLTLMVKFIFIITISGSTFLVRTLAASHGRFRNFIKTLGRTPLDEWSARHKGLYLHRTTQHRNTKTTSMTRAWFEPMIPVTKRPRPTPYFARPQGKPSRADPLPPFSRHGWEAPTHS
jgi:hypothetical protein